VVGTAAGSRDSGPFTADISEWESERTRDPGREEELRMLDKVSKKNVDERRGNGYDHG